MSKYKYLLFDNDGTLMDFDADEKVAFETCYNSYNFSVPFSKELMDIYSKINLGWWEKLEKNQCTKAELTIGRFADFFKALNINGDAADMAKQFPICLGTQNQLLPNALEILEKLSKQYKIIIITNGIAETQYSRIENSPMHKYIDKIFVSEETGFAKPAKEYFDYVLNHLNITDKSECIVIGDRLNSDIKGANTCGLDCIWCNPENEDNNGFEITHEIHDLLELVDILL
ncbi:MAG: YjjG family noncanonical pyrimidine nucleotidase [Clostridia bacterium]